MNYSDRSNLMFHFLHLDLLVRMIFQEWTANVIYINLLKIYSPNWEDMVSCPKWDLSMDRNGHIIDGTTPSAPSSC